MVCGSWLGPVRGPRGILLAGPPLASADIQFQPRLTGEAAWSALAMCESSGNLRAVGGNGRYFGAFQFTLASWRWVGMSGNPVEHPYVVQLEAARRLHRRLGWGAWPVCARRLGLLAP
jgi:resuscitation-promoting factor RpfB